MKSRFGEPERLAVSFSMSPMPRKEFCWRLTLNESEPVNLGVGREIVIKDLVHLIADLTGFRGKIRFDPPSRMASPAVPDSSRAEREFGFKARTSLEDGLRKTVEWYSKQRGW